MWTSDGMMQLQRQQTSARKKFSRFKPVKPNIVRTAAVKPSPLLENLEKIKMLWHGIEFYGQRPSSGYSYSEQYARYVEEFRKQSIDLPRSDVEKLLFFLPELPLPNTFTDKIGVFLSALIEASSDREFSLHVGFLNRKISFIGYRNTKNLYVEGDVGNYFAFRMKSGEIVLDGNSDACPGYGMEGGKLVINGDLDGPWIRNIKGGQIHFNGEGDQLDYFSKRYPVYVDGGQAFWHGKLITRVRS